MQGVTKVRCPNTGLKGKRVQKRAEREWEKLYGGSKFLLTWEDRQRNPVRRCEWRCKGIEAEDTGLLGE